MLVSPSSNFVQLHFSSSNFKDYVYNINKQQAHRMISILQWNGGVIVVSFKVGGSNLDHLHLPNEIHSHIVYNFSKTVVQRMKFHSKWMCDMGEFFQSVESSHFSNKIEQDLHNFENDSLRMMSSSSQNKKIKLKALVSCLLRVDVWATLHSTFSNDIQHTVITLESAAKNKIEI